MLDQFGSVGDSLRHARENAGLSIDDVVNVVKIRASVLIAMEKDDFSLCGGATYARGHLRQVAKVVGLDPQPLIEQVNWEEFAE